MAGRAGGDVGLRYQRRWYDHDLTFGVQGGVEDRRLEELQRYSVGAELGLSPLAVRANLYDDVPEQPATREIAERRLDAYDLELGARLPFLPWARQTSLLPFEIETGVQGEAETRSWFAQLRWRMQLGE